MEAENEHLVRTNENRINKMYLNTWSATTEWVKEVNRGHSTIDNRLEFRSQICNFNKFEGILSKYVPKTKCASNRGREEVKNKEDLEIAEKN